MPFHTNLSIPAENLQLKRRLQNLNRDEPPMVMIHHTRLEY
jgi:hypothetical protein